MIIYLKMGQNFGLQLNDFVPSTVGKSLIEESTIVYDEIVTLTYDEFVRKLGELNILCVTVI